MANMMCGWQDACHPHMFPLPVTYLSIAEGGRGKRKGGGGSPQVAVFGLARASHISCSHHLIHRPCLNYPWTSCWCGTGKVKAISHKQGIHPAPPNCMLMLVGCVVLVPSGHVLPRRRSKRGDDSSWEIPGFRQRHTSKLAITRFAVTPLPLPPA